MRHGPSFVLAFSAVVIVLTAPETRAAMRVTDTNGREIVLRRGAPAAGRPAIAGNAREVAPNADVTITAGADTDLANNDYRRIQNAINAATAGDTITLSGTFDFTQPFAAAAWALGNDGIAATGDDYAVAIPLNLADITLTATALGNATIQGPGDLAAVDLEGFLYFDGAGDNPSWTISNLQIFDFDLSIGMFNGAGGSDSYNDTTITNNLIQMPNDLNGTIAPADALQNIGIHFSFGTNQTISNNTIHIPGDSLGAAANAASVGMQSNTSGGAVYDGLLITGNTIRVLNAQAATPETVIGIWENAHGHTSNITVSNNTFVNDAAGNDPALNLQRAFRVTSHSGLATTVAYTGNNVAGANIGYQWLAASDFTGNEAVLVTGGDVTNSASGILVQSNGIAHIETMEITGSGAGGGIHVITGRLTGAGANSNAVSNSYVSGGTGDGIWIEAGASSISSLLDNHLGGNAGFGLRNETPESILAERNWWGNNLAANVAAEVSGPADFDPWLASGTDVSPAGQGFQPFSWATTSGALTTFVGSSGPDTGALLAGDPITMQMNGETATTPFAQFVNFDIQLDIGDDTFTLGQTGIPTVFDAGGDNDTLIGTNVAQTWNITGAGSGNIPGAATTFTGVESVQGGTAADTFTFGAAGSLAGSLDGNLGIDSLDNSAIAAGTITPTGPGTLDGFMGTATGIGAGFDNINLLVGEPANLVVSKTGPATATTNTQIAYTITLTNAGPNPAVDVELTDIIPAGTTFASLLAPAGWSCVTPALNTAGTVTCTRLSMPVSPGEVFTLTINGPAAPAMITNTATVTSANEGAPGDESDSAITTFNGLANLTVTKSGPGTATTNTPIAYTITVTNNGPDPAITLELTDNLPAGTTFVSINAPAWSCITPAVGANGAVTCTRASMPLGPDAITLTVNAPPTPGPITNTATVTSGNESAAGDESDSADTTVNGVADMTVTKTGPATAFTNSPVAYTITVTNDGPDPALTVQLTDVLPAGSTFNSLLAPAGWGCVTPAVGTHGTVTCTRASMAVGSEGFTLTITSPAAPGPFANTATVTSSNESAPGDESSTANTNLGSVADLSITKTAPATIPSGSVLNYAITVGNTGPDAATNVVVTDTLPAGVTFISATPSQGSCAGTTTITCNLGTILNGGSATVALSVFVNANPGTIMVNTATVDSTETDPTPLNATATATVTAAAATAAIPTASEWALLMMAMMLGMLALVRLRN